VPSTAAPPPLQTDLSAVRQQLLGMLQQDRKEEALDLILGLLSKMLEKNTLLEFRLQMALRQLYRKKSEKLSGDQLLLFLSQLEPAQASKAQVETEPVPPTPPTPPNKPPAPRPPRKPLPPHLRRVVRRIDPAPEQMVCGQCHARKEPMGFDVRETLEFQAAELYVLQEQLVKCVCKHCEEGVVRGEPTPKPIEGARPGPGLLAHLLVSKYQDSQPLHRQAQMWLRQGVELSSSTLGDWTAGAIDVLEPLAKEAKAQLLRCALISSDDIKLPVLDQDHPQGIKKGHIWTYLGDFDQVLLNEYTPTWEGDGPKTVLQGFTGFIQGDGYAGIADLFTGPDPPLRVGCMAHCRRYFIKALDAKDLRAAVVVKLIGTLYEVEAQARADGLGPDDLLARRQALSRPVMDRLQQVISELHGQAVPKSPMGRATTYAINQWPTLGVFLRDGRVPIDNLHVERAHRKIALGRKNYLFCGSDEGARRHAIISTVLGNCALCGVNPVAYLRDVLGKLAGDFPRRRLAELMPRAWATAQKEAQQAQAQEAAAG
jgi:transposase